MDLDELFSRKSAATEKPRPLPEAQIMELRAAFESYGSGDKFEPGDLVQDKHGMGLLRDADSVVQLFWRWLDPENWYDRKMIEEDFTSGSAQCPDCVVAYLSPHGRLMFLARDSQALMRRPENEATEAA